jgi:AmmeMemoRadiSam system protein B
MRYPAVAGRFYPMDRDELRNSIESCFTHPLGPGKPSGCTGERRISAVVCPHAGYSCSGMNAAHSFKAIAEDGLPEAYVLIGPDHYGIPYNVVMCGEEYLTPLGPCKIHGEIAAKMREYIPDDPRAHTMEHSIEVEVPFLQYIDTDPHIVPIIMGDQDIRSARRLSEQIAAACKGHDVVIIASSDMAHYVPKDVGLRLNTLVMDRLVAKDMEGMYNEVMSKRITVCGYGPIATAVMAARPESIEVLKYSDSWDSTGYDPTSVVGYMSAKMTRP